jgi:phosphoribosylaminoimidazole-succinocarboxamide synthase
MTSAALHTSTLTSLPLLARGKVRDNYAVGDDRILMVASDRLSAFDVILGEPIPGKGALLTQMALFWFAQAGHICPNHLTGDAPESVVTPAEERDQVTGRSMLVKRLADPGRGGGARLPGRQRLEGVPGRPVGLRRTPAAGLHNASKLPEPIYTRRPRPRWVSTTRTSPTSAWSRSIGRRLAAQIRETSIALYKAAAAIALAKGIIIADTKFEFGLDKDGPLVLMDEVLTPDSSRFWPIEGYTMPLPKAATRPATTSSSCATGWSRCVSTASPGTRRPRRRRLPQEVIDQDGSQVPRSPAAI